MLIRFLLLAIVSTTLLMDQAYSEQSGCAEALVIATYSRVTSDHLDWRLASFVTENEYNEIKHDAGANAVIYGVPVGANYSDYQNRVSEIAKSYNESLSVDQATNIMWTGLDPNAANAYSECLKAKVFSQPGLHIGVKSATKNQVSVLIVWTPVGAAGNATPTWQWKGADSTQLPKTIQPGSHIAVLGRPKEQQILAANFSGYADSLVVEPYPPPPTPAKTHLEQTAETYRSPTQTGWGNIFSRPYAFCTPDKPAGWTIVKLVDFHLESPDGRGCSTYATCSGGEADTATRICRAISVQGYNKGENGGYASATGVMTVIWSHPVDNAPALALLAKYHAAMMVKRSRVAVAPGPK